MAPVSFEFVVDFTYCEAVNQFNETAQFYRERFTTRRKKAKD